MHKQLKNYQHYLLVALLAFGWSAASVCAAPVDENVIRRVAINYINNHIGVHGSWNGAAAPTISAIRQVTYEGQAVAYNVSVSPSGHLFMAYDDDFSPVLLYSPTSDFNPDRVEVPDTPESWIIPETFNVYQDLKQRKLASAGQDAGISNQAQGQSRSGRAWGFFNRTARVFRAQSRIDVTLNREFSADAAAIDAAAAVGPLLTTSWNQESNTYNLYTPAVSGAGGCTRTPTGCVATAAAQIMKYWNWPTTGVGSHSYPWNSQTLDANFNHAYNWSSMPNTLSASSSTTQIDAVARLMSDLGIAAEMNYGCSSSGANTEKMATTVLPTYFKYKKNVQANSRSSYTAPAFFSLIKADLDASPPRPMLFRMNTANKSGHAIVADGYQTGTTDMLHVNMGWGGSYNGYYDISNNWTTGSYTWVATSQVVFTGIEPDNAVSCFPTISSDSQWADAAGQAGSVNVAASTGCPWSAVSNAGWISVGAGASGNGNGTVNYSVAANVSTASRSGTLTVAGQTFTVSQAGSGGTASNLLVNPGFESGALAWTESTTGGFDIIWNEASAHTGSYDAWLGGYVSGSDSLYQNVTIPVNAQTANLQYWSWIETDEPAGSDAYDYFTVALYDGTTGAYLSTIGTLSNRDAASGWVFRTAQFDVSAFRGKPVYLMFTSSNDDTLFSSFWIDDTSLTISTGGSTLPSAPAIGTATAGNSSVSVSFAPGAIGSGTLVSYWAACSSNDVDFVFGSGTSSPVTVTGLTNGVAYRCQALARSTAGDGAWSAVSNPATPTALPNYSDSWWNANESGWGITITDHGTNLFVQWYTYDQTGHNQKYVISGGTFSNGKCRFSGTIQHVTGPGWTLSSFNPNLVVRTTVGSGTIDFCPAGLAAGTIVFSYTADGVSGSKQLTRLPFGNDVPHLGGTANTGAADFTDLWWNPSESGWGVSVTQHGNNIFFRVFVYDTDGRPLLFVVPGVTFNSATSFTGALQLTSGPWFGSNPFNPNQVVRTTAGSATLTFSDASNGVLSYTVNGVTKTKSITRVAF